MRETVSSIDWRSWYKALFILGLLLLFFHIQSAFAASSGNCAGNTGGNGNSGNPTLGTLADNLDSTFGSLAQLLTAASYILGFGFTLASIFKFKAHKDSPQQIPIGAPIALLFIGIAMVFLPSVLTTTGTTLFGTSGQTGGISGVCTFGNFTTPSS